MGEVVVGTPVVPWRVAAEQALRRLAPITVAGALLGVLVGGVCGRLAMMLLAVLNARATGVTSDDGFTIGQFTVPGSVNLLMSGFLLGMMGAAVYAVLRGLMVGPRWFQVLSISVGPAVVVGSMIVHPDGVDFTLLEPLWLAIALFIAVPAVYAALLTLLAERWMSSDGWFANAPLGAVLVTLVFWLPVAPLAALLVAAWFAGEAVARVGILRRMATNSAVLWVARGGLVAVFALAVVDLTTDVSRLT